jgi:hypothetical protein
MITVSEEKRPSLTRTPQCKRLERSLLERDFSLAGREQRSHEVVGFLRGVVRKEELTEMGR